MNEAKELVAFEIVFLSWTEQLKGTLFSFSCFFSAVTRIRNTYLFIFNESLDNYAAPMIPASEVEVKHLTPWLGS